MKKICYLFFLAISISYGYLYAQDGPVQKDTNTDTFLIIFRFENIPTSYWSYNKTSATMLFNCFIYDNTNVFPDNEELLTTMTNEDSSFWSYRTNISNRTILKWLNFYSPKYSYDGSVLPLGKYDIEITDKNGNKIHKIIDTTNILKYHDKSFKYIYSPNYTGSINTDYVPALSRAIITSIVKTKDKITVIFSCNDDRIQNGCVNFFDNTGQVNYTSYFYNTYSKQKSPFLNNGNGLNIDGTENTITLNISDIFFKENKSFENIKTAVISLLNVDNPIPSQQTSDTVILSSNTEYFLIEQ